jgi:hypothetical protein
MPELETKLRKTTLGALLDAERLPSGVPYTLHPDTVEFGLKVAEAADPLKWREKALQVMAVVDTVNGQSVKSSGGVEFVCSLLDTDVVFLAMAWSCGVNGRDMKFDKALPCPRCTTPFQKVDLGQLTIMARDEQATGVHAIQELVIEPELLAKLPPSIRDGKLLVKDPTWRDARSRVPANCAGDLTVIDVHRALCAVMVQHGEKAPRAVVQAESKQFPMKAIQVILAEMDRLVPNFNHELQFVCKECGLEIDIPFDRAGA